MQRLIGTGTEKRTALIADCALVRDVNRALLEFVAEKTPVAA
jgi:hypothetical protein